MERRGMPSPSNMHVLDLYFLSWGAPFKSRHKLFDVFKR